ncbi:MAG: hypothetical protein Q8P73_04540 [bacterium]|nr:hypothetical protein [bacterium]
MEKHGKTEVASRADVERDPVWRVPGRSDLMTTEEVDDLLVLPLDKAPDPDEILLCDGERSGISFKTFYGG